MKRRGWTRSGKGGGKDSRLEMLEAAVERLREEAEYGTVVVEGVRDIAALAWLGIGGQHRVVHRGRPLEAIVEELVQSPAPIVLLLDWDRAGGRLERTLEEALRARVQVDTACRRRLGAACQCKCLEDVPAELTALREAA